MCETFPQPRRTAFAYCRDPAPSTIATDGHPFNGLVRRTAWVSPHQEGETILDFNDISDDRMAVASAGLYANHLHLAPDRSPRQQLVS